MIKDIKEAGKVEVLALIRKCEQSKTNKGTPYLSLTLEDASGSLDAKFWNLTEEQANAFHVGMVVEAHGDGTDASGNPRLFEFYGKCRFV